MSDSLSSCLYSGFVLHHRFTPKRHRFNYRVFALCLDLDELPALHRHHRWFSVNRPNLFAFYERDHGAGTGSLRDHITGLLRERGFESATARIRLLCYPRILGYAFNPLSVYFCYDATDTLQVVLYEVNNTFGQRHAYLLPATPSSTGHVRHSCSKQMYVSPFMPMATDYSFRILPPDEQVQIFIRQQASELREPVLNACFSGERRALSDSALWQRFVRYPMMTLKVITAIHWEALRLWRKGLALQPRPEAARYSISWRNKTGVIQHESI